MTKPPSHIINRIQSTTDNDVDKLIGFHSELHDAEVAFKSAENKLNDTTKSYFRNLHSVLEAIIYINSFDVGWFAGDRYNNRTGFYVTAIKKGLFMRISPNVQAEILYKTDPRELMRAIEKYMESVHEGASKNPEKMESN